MEHDIKCNLLENYDPSCRCNCHKANKGHVYSHEDADCEKCGVPWSDNKTICEKY